MPPWTEAGGWAPPIATAQARSNPPSPADARHGWQQPAVRFRELQWGLSLARSRVPRPALDCAGGLDPAHRISPTWSQTGRPTTGQARIRHLACLIFAPCDRNATKHPPSVHQTPQHERSTSTTRTSRHLPCGVIESIRHVFDQLPRHYCLFRLRWPKPVLEGHAWRTRVATP